jgi:hypothetical protein
MTIKDGSEGTAKVTRGENKQRMNNGPMRNVFHSYIISYCTDFEITMKIMIGRYISGTNVTTFDSVRRQKTFRPSLHFWEETNTLLSCFGAVPSGVDKMNKIGPGEWMSFV